MDAMNAKTDSFPGLWRKSSIPAGLVQNRFHVLDEDPPPELRQTMPDKTQEQASHHKPQQVRKDRLKAALKANMSRRKAQARARAQARKAEARPQEQD